MPGDVFGFFATSRILNQEGNSLQLDSMQNDEHLWYAVDGIDAARGSGSVSIGENHLSSMIGPVLSVRVMQ